MAQDVFDIGTYRGMTIKAAPDDMADDPRDMDDFGHMICFNRRHNIGDNHSMTREELLDEIDRKDVVALPLYLFDHGGITISTQPFYCPWDGGQVGYFYVTHNELRREFGKQRVSKKLRESAKKIMQSIVRDYDYYIRGEVWLVWVVDEKDKIITDSFFQNIGPVDDTECLHECYSAINGEIRERREKRMQRLKELIRNKVPLDKRKAIVAEMEPIYA